MSSLKGGSIPIFDPHKLRDRPHLAELQRRTDSARPLGMFRSTETEFFLVYDSFGLYVDRYVPVMLVFAGRYHVGPWTRGFLPTRTDLQSWRTE